MARVRGRVSRDLEGGLSLIRSTPTIVRITWGDALHPPATTPNSDYASTFTLRSLLQTPEQFNPKNHVSSELEVAPTHRVDCSPRLISTAFQPDSSTFPCPASHRTAATTTCFVNISAASAKVKPSGTLRKLLRYSFSCTSEEECFAVHVQMPKQSTREFRISIELPAYAN